MNPTPPRAAEVDEAYFVPAMFRVWADVLLAAADLRPGERVLDIATGTGVVARHAAPIVGARGSVTAIDMNPAMLASRVQLPITGAHRWLGLRATRSLCRSTMSPSTSPFVSTR